MTPKVESFLKENINKFTYHQLCNILREDFGEVMSDDAIRKYCNRHGWGKTENNASFEKIVFMTCLHIPFHDPKLLALFFVFLKYFKPDRLFILGDFLDWYQVSSFNKDPKRVGHLQEDLDKAGMILDELANFVSKIEFLDGNHEYRLTRYLRNNPEFYGLRCLSVPALLNLGKRGIKHHEYMDPPMKYHGFQIHHGSVVRKWSGWTAKAHWEKFGGCGIIGHSHRGGNFLKRTSEEICGWYENMCLCQLEPEYLDFADWVQGWSIAYFTKKDLFHLEQIPIIKHEFLFQGKLFSA